MKSKASNMLQRVALSMFRGNSNTRVLQIFAFTDEHFYFRISGNLTMQDLMIGQETKILVPLD